MKKLLAAAAFLMASTAFAYGPFYFHYIAASGYPGMWGYVPWMYTPGYWYYPNYSGFSYYPVFNYQPRYASFGSIAYSPSTDTLGSSWGQPNFNVAVNVASQNCGVSDCQPVVWVQGGCAVVTTSKSAKRVTWGTGTTRMAAFQASLGACVDANGDQAQDCAERAWVCSY